MLAAPQADASGLNMHGVILKPFRRRNSTNIATKERTTLRTCTAHTHDLLKWILFYKLIISTFYVVKYDINNPNGLGEQLANENVGVM